MSAAAGFGTEGDQLQKRFGSALVRENHSISLSFRPTDPDVPVDVGTLHIKVTANADYPISPATVVVTEAAAPAPIVAALNKYIGAFCKKYALSGQPHVKKCIQWLDNHFSDILSEILRLQAEAADRSIKRIKSVDITTPPQTAAASSLALSGDNIASSSSSTEAPVVAPSASPASAIVSCGSDNQWTYEQQYSLERAIREQFVNAHNSITSMHSWERIAAQVGKPPEACISRYLAIRKLVSEWIASVAPPPMVLERHISSSYTDSAADQYSVDSKQYTDRHPRVDLSVDLSEYRKPPTEISNKHHAVTHTAASEDESDVSDDDSASGDSEHSSDIDNAVLEAIEYGPADTTTTDFADMDASGDVLIPFMGVSLDAKPHGTCIDLLSSSFFGVGTVAASRVDVSAQCDRCANVFTASLNGAKLRSTDTSGDKRAAESDAIVPFKAWCLKCSLLHELSLTPLLIHEGNPRVGYISTVHCTISTLQSAFMFASCLECGQVAEVSGFCPPMTWEATCRRCFARLRLDARGVDVSIATREHAAARAFDPKTLKDRKFQVGRCLPDQGTCVHFRQSYRWLRFPCCGVAYPCPICHDEASDHAHSFASRMICGHCAREQKFSNEPCVSCGKTMVRKATGAARFWEGGAGQRNRALLSRRDPRKYKDSKLKTKSKKSERVGKKK